MLLHRKATHLATPSARRLTGFALFCAALLCATFLLPPRWAVLLVIAPVLEEIVLRAGLQEALLRRLASHGTAAAAANLACAIAFAAAHWMLRPGAFAALTLVPALWLGWVYQRNRCVAPCITHHAAMNALWLLWLAGTP